MTPQEIFDKVATHLLAQNAKSLTEHMGECMYRGNNGTTCAVGCLIPDELYTEDMERKNIAYLLEWAIDNDVVDKFDAVGINQTNLKLLIALQNMHDKDLVETWQYKLQIIAVEFGLEWRH